MTSSLSSVRSGLSWNFWASTNFRRICAVSCDVRSANSRRVKIALLMELFSVRHFASSARLPASTMQRRCGHSESPETLSICLLRASWASSPRRSDLSESFSWSASLTSMMPPSLALATFFIRASTSPLPQPESRSLRVTSTTWPVLRTPSFSSRAPSSRATVPEPEPAPLWTKAKCRARDVLSPVTELRRRCTSIKFRACRMESFTSRRPTSPPSAPSRSNASAVGAGEMTSCLISSSTWSAGMSSTSAWAW
mmetsp:Transcript_78708/g.223104  ORF Transcript_78708/g.223104 Transcript_78708/m.223104 type:complete len:253 (+) Transcript_78708:1118-1876(+)